MLVGWQRLLQQNIYNMFCPVVPPMFVLPLQHSLLDDHLIRICLVKTLPSKKPAGKEKKKKPMAKEIEYSILMNL